MLRVIRKGVFETNSSSSHSITIADTGKLTNMLHQKDGIITMQCGEFGWEVEDHIDAYTKLSYLLTYVFEGCEVINGEFSISTLPEHKKEALARIREAVENFTGAILVVKPLDSYYPRGYIDHQSIEVAEEVATSTVGKIKRFIFNPLSVLHIGNDNEW